MFSNADDRFSSSASSQNRQATKNDGLSYLPSQDRALSVDQHSLARQTPFIAAQFSRAADHTMARDDERNTIARAGTGYGANRPRLTYAGGHFTVRLDLAVRYLLKVVPDPHLKRRRLDVKRKIEIAALTCDEFVERFDPTLEVRVQRAARGFDGRLRILPGEFAN